MSRGLKILNGISKWIRESVGPEAQNREDDTSEDEADGDVADDGASDERDSPVCCSAASNTDLTVLDS